MIADTLKQVIAEAAQAVLGSVPDFTLEHPSDLSHGDYSTNVAMVGAKAAGKNPRQLAEEIVAALGELESVERTEIAGPGFINFYLTRHFFKDSLNDVLQHSDEWGTNQTLAGKTVMVEYTSPNLFKPLHIGNLMSNIIGEAVARLTAASGAQVIRVNYPSDIGLTVAKGVWALQQGGFDPNNIADLGAAYRLGNAAYEDDEQKKAEIDIVNKALYQGDDETLNQLRRAGIETSKRHLDEICALLGTVFDFEIYESEAGPVGLSIVKEKLTEGIFTESNGAVVFVGEDHGLHTRVFINSAGLPTYEAKDIGLIKLKRGRQSFDLSITTTAVEQKEYFKVLIKAAELVFPELAGKLKHIPYGYLTLTTGKMSSRKGNVITGESLISEMQARAHEKMEGRDLNASEKDAVADAVAVAAIKFMVLRQGTERNIVFNPEASLSFEGDSGPYLQYSHTRAMSILRKANDEGVVASNQAEPTDETTLERLLYRFPEVVVRAQAEYEPHYVTTYLTELAGEFNSWYASTPIVDGNDETSPYKVALTQAFQITMKNGLALLGIKAPERM